MRKMGSNNQPHVGCWDTIEHGELADRKGLTSNNNNTNNQQKQQQQQKTTTTTTTTTKTTQSKGRNCAMGMCPKELEPFEPQNGLFETKLKCRCTSVTWIYNVI